VNVLVADDSPETASRIMMLLEEAGFRPVGPAHDGREALRLFGEHDPDAAILDLSMPLLGGLAVATRIRQQRRGCLIVIFTGHGEPSLVSAGLDAGANAVIHKSTDFEHVVALLRARERAHLPPALQGA
jgi:DNA-binding response OmpR family regulator